MQDENPAKLRETLQIAKFDMEKQDELSVPETVTVSDKFYTKDRVLVSSTTFDIPGWLGEWSLHNVRLMPMPEIVGHPELAQFTVAYPPGVPRRSKVAIIGSQSEYIPKPPLNSDEWEVWGCNSLWSRTRDRHDRFRADRWFELHPMDKQTPKELEAIRDCPIPIYTLEPEPTFENSLMFPLDLCRRLYPYDFYACTFAYQMALAIAEGFTEIGIFGTELMFGSPRERLFELRSLEFWIGIALGKGIKVHLPPKSRLCRHPFLYGYDYEAEKDYCDRKTEFFSMLQGNDQVGLSTWFKAEAAKEQEEYFGGEVPE